MATSAPITTVSGSQTEFSKVWIRGSTATTTLPNVKFFTESGRIVHPVAAQLDVTVVHTAASTLYDRIQAAITAADATKNAAWVARWFGKHRIVGFACDAVTGDTLLVNRAETTGLTDSNNEPTARAAGDFYAQETFNIGSRFRHGLIAGDQANLTNATVNVSGEVEVAAANKLGASVSGTLTNANDVVSGDCTGMATVIVQLNTVSTTGPNVRIDVYREGVWRQIPFSTRGLTSSTGGIAISTSSLGSTTEITFSCAGATQWRIVMTGGATGPHTVLGRSVASPYLPIITQTQGPAAHDATASSAGNPNLIGIESRSSDGTAVGNGDVVRALGTLLGKLVNYPHALPGSTWNYAAASGGIANATPVEAKAAVASTYQYVTGAQIVNQSTTAVEVEIRHGTTALWRCELDADGGAAGISIQFPVPLRGASGAAINIYTSGTGKVFCNLQGFSALE